MVSTKRETLQDTSGRVLDYLRISITDRCNFSCMYCGQVPPSVLLADNHVIRLAALFANHGFSTIRLTGGEPLLRPSVISLTAQLAKIAPHPVLSMTTNGYLLAPLAHDLAQNGLSSINISLDATDEILFSKLSGGHEVAAVLAGIEQALQAGLKVKLNCVLLREYYVQQIKQLMHFAKTHHLAVRFIELMPIGGGDFQEGVSSDEVAHYLESSYGRNSDSQEVMGKGPSVYHRYGDVDIGFISSMTHSFCSRCNRLRLTASGILLGCLYQREGLDLYSLVSKGLADEEIWERVKLFVHDKPISSHHVLQHNRLRSLAGIGG